SYQVILIRVVVSQQSRWSVVRHDQEIEIAVVIVVAVRGSSSNYCALHRSTESCSRFLKLLFAFVMKDVRRLCVLDVRLNDRNVVRNVTISREDIQQSIEVVIKEKSRER